jgi:hypothetical protein
VFLQDAVPPKQSLLRLHDSLILVHLLDKILQLSNMALLNGLHPSLEVLSLQTTEHEQKGLNELYGPFDLWLDMTKLGPSVLLLRGQVLWMATA